MKRPYLDISSCLRSKTAGMDIVPSKIDAESGIISDVVMVQEGEALGHGVELDADFISALVAYDRKYYNRTGLKARFGHPSMSSEAMGTQLGVYRNFRKREKNGKMQAIADLHLLESAESSPTHPGMRSWVLQMAAERPDFIMSSIVFRASSYFQRKKNGNKKRIDDYYEDYDSELGPVYVAFDEAEGAAHYSTDLVEQGAATDNLFAANRFSPHLFVSQVHTFLAEHPHIQQFITEKPEKVVDFLHKIGIPVTIKMEKPSPKTGTSTGFFTSLFGKKEEPSVEEKFAYSLDALVSKVEALAAGNEALQNSLKSLETDIAALKSDLQGATTRLSTIEAQPVAPLTGGDTPPVGGSEKRSYQVSPITIAGRKAAGFKD